MHPDVKNILYRYILPYGGLLLLKAISFTYRIKFVDIQIEKDIVEKYNGIIYASWHQRFFAGITLFGKRESIAIMISRSRDGELISSIAGKLGITCVRGSSSRGGGQALREIQQLANEGYRIGHIVDGPQGPFGVIKPGLIRMAQATGKPVVPTITSAQDKWIFNSWDRFMVPKPFSRIIIRFGDPYHVPKNLDEHEFENHRTNIEKQMKQLYEETDLFWTNPLKIREVFG